jgi:hypothetical protein
MARVKETDFFVPGRGYDTGGPAAYDALFPEGGRVRGECSPNYTKRHLFPGVAARMHATVPEARLVYVVRDPVARAYSHYGGWYVEGSETRLPEAAMRPFEASNYVQTSRYAWQLAPFVERYGADRLHVLTLEALRDRPRHAMRALLGFLGLPPHAGALDVQAFNRSAPKRRYGAWMRFVSGRLLSQRVKDRIRPYVPVRWLPGRAVEVPPMPETLRADLARYLRPDVNALRALTGCAFGEWESV